MNDLPDEFAFLNEAQSVFICQSKENKDLYDISVGVNHKIHMSTADKERLELMLISHPLVKAYIKPIFSRS